MPIKGRSIRGIRDSIPGGYVIGRAPGSGKGPAGLIKFKQNADLSVGGGGGGGGGGGATKIAFEFFGQGLMRASEMFGQAIVPANCTLFPSLTGSYAFGRTLANSAFSLDIQKIVAGVATSVGSVDWSAASADATFTFVSPVSFTAGQGIRLQVPAAADPVLADVTVMLYASL